MLGNETEIELVEGFLRYPAEFSNSRLDKILNRDVVAHDVRNDASLHTARLVGASSRVNIHMANTLLDREAAIPQHPTVSVDYVNKLCISFVNSLCRTSNVKKWFSRIESGHSFQCSKTHCLNFLCQESCDMSPQAVTNNMNVLKSTNITQNLDKVGGMFSNSSCSDSSLGIVCPGL